MLQRPMKVEKELERIREFTQSLVNGNYNQRLNIDVDDTPISAIAKNLNGIADTLLISSTSNNNNKVADFIDVISSYANLRFEKTLAISTNNTILDAVATGINILGEELEQTAVSRDYFTNMYNSVSDALIITDLFGKIKDVNLAAYKIFNRQENISEFANLHALLNVNSQNIPDKLESLFKDNTSYSFEMEYASGKKSLILACTLYKISTLNHSPQGYLLKAENITEKKIQAQKELEISINAQEKERLRLAYDLHDALGQEINALKMFMSSLNYMEKSSAEFTETIASCKELIDNSVEVIRNITFNLMPKALEKGGVLIAINELAKKISPVCPIHYNMPEYKLNLSSENQIMLYRIVQEFINNSLKHSKCTRINISISKTKDKIFIGLYDNGIGFDFDNIAMGNGLLNITYRLNALKSTYKMTSKINEGTSLEIALLDETN
jgi:signal transduction histidine kinase